jgi:DNA gyrase subunit A
VRIINLRDGDAIASVMAVPANDDAESAENLESAEGVAPAEGVAMDAEGQVAEAEVTEQTTNDAE